MGYDYCIIYDALEIRRCFKCWGFNHIAKNCNKEIVCPKCSESHASKDCKSDVLKCFLCSNLKGKQNLDIDTEHATFDRKLCHVYKHKLEEFKSEIINVK